jgi:peptidoglycan/xylan/chitin deacetylase (PgdA/CDA1 family)
MYDQGIMLLRSRARAYLAGGLRLLVNAVAPHYQRRHYGKTRVLVFHHIDKPELFGDILAMLTRCYRLISFADYLQGKKSTAHINVIIAFDDGYRSWFDSAWPMLQQYKIAPLLFVNSNFVGLDERAAHDFCVRQIGTWPEASIQWQQLQNMAVLGAEIGGHGKEHLNLIKTDFQHVKTDIADDRTEIEKRLGAKPHAFAYPFGLYNQTATAAVASAGYDYAFTSDSGFLEDSAGPLLLKRSNVGLRPVFVVAGFVEGWADFVSVCVAWIKRKGRH